MPAEWQTRQLRFVASASCPPGKARSALGRLTLTDFSEICPAVCAAAGDNIAQAPRATISIRIDIHSSSIDGDRCLFDDVAHETRRVPVGYVGLHLAVAIGASRHKHVVSRSHRSEERLPLAETI